MHGSYSVGELDTLCTYSVAAMAASVHTWHGHLDGSFMEGIEEGLLDETDKTILKFQEKSTAFPRTAKHGWKELVSDPSHSEIEISENSKTLENPVGIGHKDWDHYLSAFSLNDEDTTKFMALEVHTDHGQEDFCISDRADFKEQEHFDTGNMSGTVTMHQVEKVTQPVVSKIAGKRDIETQEDLNQEMMEQRSSLMNSFCHSLEDAACPTISKQNSAPPRFAWSAKEDSPDGRGLYETSKAIVRPDSAPTIGGGGINPQPGLMSGTGPLPTSDMACGLQKTLRMSVGVDWQPLVQLDKRSPHAYWQTEPIMRASSLPARETTQTSVEQRNILPVDVDHISDVINSPRNFSLSNIDHRNGENKKLQARPKSALDVHGNNYFPKQSITAPRTNSAPLWQDTDTSKQSPSLGAVSQAHFQTKKAPSHDEVHFQLKETTRMDYRESPLEQRKISGADENTNSVVSEKTLHEVERSLVGNVLNDTHSVQTSFSPSRPNSNFTRHAIGMSREELMVEKESISFEDYPHLSGDGMKSDDDVKGNFDASCELKETNTGDTDLELKDGDRHSIVGNVSDESDSKTERDSALLAELRLNTNSSDTKHMSRPDHAESTTDTTNVATSREAAENLPVRPLTIGNSLTIGSTLAYRPISPFQPDLYPTSTTTSVPMVPSTSSVATTYNSPSQYSEGMLDADEESGDMSARERLQPLGRDGLEVKQGPPWGITMPLFQPDSRNSSLSSNDSSTSNTQFLQVQTTSNQQFKLETEPLQSMSSTPSEADLSRKASIKSLEPKEPMGVKMMSGAGKTPIGKFHQQNPVDGDSPVSKILGPTFKTTQKMLEELQRRPLGAYDEDLEQLPMDTENTRNTYERESYVERETPIERDPVSDNRPNRSYGGRESAESSRVEERSGQDSKRSHDSTSSGQRINKTTHDSYHEVSINQQPNDLTPITTANFGDINSTRSFVVEDLQEDRGRKSSCGGSPTRDTVHEFSTNQRTPDLTPITTAHLAVVNNHSTVTDGLQGGQVSRPFSDEKETKTLTKIAIKDGSKNQPKLDLTPITMANIGLVSTTRSPVASVKDSIPQRVVSNPLGSPSRRNESRKTQQTSGLTDSTLGNSIGLSNHLGPTKVETLKEGAEFRSAEPESPKSDNVLENRFDASDLSEFDRVASASISWSNAVASQFREEMKSVNSKVQEGFLDHKHDETSVNEQGATTPILDSGLSESSTNDEIYRPKQLARLSAGNGPVGIYDIRQSSGPGSSNRKRLALGKKPRESSKYLRMGDIYVSDGSMGTSGTDRDNQRKSRKFRHRVHGGVYVSEGTTSGTEPVDNGIDSGPEGQSTPKSEDISARQSNTHTTSDFSPKESSKPMTDIYLGLTKAEKPKRGSRSGFNTYEIEKPARLSPSAFINYRPSPFEIDKPQRANPSGTSRNGTVIRESDNLETKILAGLQQGGNVTQPAAQVEHTWSISRPVMSQLSTGAAPLVIHDVFPEPRSTTQQQSLKQTTSYQPVHWRSPRPKKTVPKTVREHVKDQASSSMESEKKHNGPIEKKKSVADIILENMIQDEQEQKKRHKKLEVKQKQTTQDLNQLWERFQDVFGQKSRSSRRSKTGQRSRPCRETTPTDISMASSSDTKNKNIGRQSIDVSTDSDEEFERFLRRIREIQSSESSYQEDNVRSSRPLSSHQRMTHGRSESETTPSEYLRRKPLHKAVDSSTSMASTASSDDGRMRRPQVSSRQKATRQSVDGPVIPSSSVTERKSETPVSLPMWLSVKNAEMMKQGKTSASCTCGAKSRKETQKTISVRDIGINCPTPPIVAQEFMPVATDIAVLKTGPSEENISNSASLVKLSLQDAFLYSQQQFIERSRERVKRLKEKREDRQNEKTSSAQVVIVMPSEKTKPKKENKKPDEDMLLHMKSNKQFEQLQRKKPRPMSTKEIRDVNKRMYKNLPEVRKRRDEERRAEFYTTNRLRAQLYGKNNCMYKNSN